MKISNRSLRFNVLIVLITGILLFISVLIFVPDRLFDLPRKNQKIWLMLCLLYPLVSAFSQEIVFRTFLFRRYKKLFHRPIYYILASAVCFSFAHIMYFSWVSVILTFILGLYLSNIYIKTKSVLLTTIIHSVLGIIVFTIGLGQYFWITIGSNL
ncbi:MAG: CPBP family glutamic-type intramembrane protease [Bacteroidales bacterium]|nr:CPBP family glutamic-type intramembrane protease [Bacteroidales bacterium]